MSPNEAGDHPRVLDAAALAVGADRDGVFWSISSDQLNVNLVRLGAGHGVDQHVNDQVDVLGVVVAGSAVLTLPDSEHQLRPGMIFFVPRGTPRRLYALDQGFAYVSCHQRRPGLWPEAAPMRAGPRPPG